MVETTADRRRLGRIPRVVLTSAVVALGLLLTSMVSAEASNLPQAVAVGTDHPPAIEDSYAPVTEGGDMMSFSPSSDSSLLTSRTVTEQAQLMACCGRSFDWDFYGRCCINSRTWTTSRSGSIWLDVDYVYPCTTINGDLGPDLRFTLYRQTSTGGYTNVGYRYIYNCDYTDVSWSGQPTGRYYFRLQKLYPHRDAQYTTIEGTLAYDGSTT